MNKKLILVTIVVMLLLTVQTALAWSFRYPHRSTLVYRPYRIDWNRCDQYVIRRPQPVTYTIRGCRWPNICQRFVFE